ncbi:hypothetical protein YC2023_079257 [Brassica napus]
MSNMNNDQESIQFWSSLLHSVADSDPKDDHLSEISSPIMVMSTSMAIDVSPKPFNAPRDGHKAGPQKAIAETGDISIDEGGQRSAEKHIEVIKKEGEKEEIKNFGKNKRPRTNEARNTAEKSQSMGPMLPLGMKMDFPAPWFPSIPPNFIMPPFSGFTPGETSCAYGNQNIEPSTTKLTITSNMDKDRESLQFWSSLLYSLADSDPKDGLFPEINSPIMVMSTSMATDGKAISETGDKIIHEGGQRSAEKEIEVEKKVGATEETKNLGKRPRTNEARNIAEKRRRADIKTKIENLKQLTPNCKKRDIASILDCIIDNIRWMKHYVESQSMGPMLPLGMKMDFPAPWFPFSPPIFIMPRFVAFTPGETSGGNQQSVPVTTKV